jgi:hypothetical protein
MMPLHSTADVYHFDNVMGGHNNINLCCLFDGYFDSSRHVSLHGFVFVLGHIVAGEVSMSFTLLRQPLHSFHSASFVKRCSPPPLASSASSCPYKFCLPSLPPAHTTLDCNCSHKPAVFHNQLIIQQQRVFQHATHQHHPRYRGPSLRHHGHERATLVSQAEQVQRRGRDQVR